MSLKVRKAPPAGSRPEWARDIFSRRLSAFAFSDGRLVDGEIEERGRVIGMIGEERFEDTDFVGGGGRNFFILR